MIKPFALVYPITMAIHIPVVNQNVSSIPIAQRVKRVLIRAVKIHVKYLRAVLMLNVAFMIIPLIVIAAMDLQAMHSYTAYRHRRLEIKPLIHALNHHVWTEVFAMYTEMLLFVIHVQMKMATIIQAVDPNVCRIAIVNSIKLV